MYKNIFTGLFGILIIFFVFGCKPAQDSFFTAPVNSTESTAKKISQRSLDVNIKSNLLDNLTDVYWRGFITNIFTNREAYEITRVDTNPKRELKVLSAQLNKNRQNYIVKTQQNISPGRYLMTIYQTSLDKFIEFEFDVNASDGNTGFGDEDAGNYPPFEPVHRFYEDGTIFSVLDAEIGAPSFYVVSLAMPVSTYQQIYQSSGESNENNFKGKMSIQAAQKSNHALNEGTQIYAIRESFATGIDPELIYNFDQKADPKDGTKVLNENTVKQNSFYQNKYLAQNVDFSSFNYKTLGHETPAELAGEGGYHVLEMIVFLDAMPKEGDVYNASFDFSGNAASWALGSDLGKKGFKSGAFTFRNAFARSILTAKLSLKADNSFCLLSEASGRIKCLGENQGGQTGYDTSRYISDHPYRLAFVPNVDKVHDIALNISGQTACAITDHDPVNKISQTKCWGTNVQGNLGIGDYFNIAQIGSDGEISPQSGSVVQKLPEFSTPVIPSGVVGFQADTIDSVDQSFCVLTFDKQYFCWGRYVANADEYNVPLEASNSITSSPSVVVPLYNSKPIVNISYSAIGNNPIRCLIGDVPSANPSIEGGIFCKGSSSNTVLKSLPALPSGEKPFKLAIGEGHLCAVTAKNNAQGELDFTGVTNNVYCYGENANSELGINDTANRTNFVRANMGGDTATDVMAGARHTCYISVTKRMKCVGIGDDIVEMMTNDANPADGFAGGQYLSFGKSLAGNELVSVDGVSRSTYITCVDLSYEPEDQPSGTKLYGSKCWGNYGLVGNNYYISGTNGLVVTNSNSNVYRSYIDYTPMLRW